jgi:hypothetical protein
MRPNVALQKDHVVVDQAGENNMAKQSAGPSTLAEGQWWWD